MKAWLSKILPKKERELKDRSQRVRLLFRDVVYVVSEHGRFSVQNLSETGLGFYHKEGTKFSSSFSARVFLNDETIPVQLEVVRSMPDFIGARFIGDRTEVKAALRRFFIDELKASQMSEVASDKIQANEGGKPRWFYAPGNYELFFIENEGRITRVELDLGGRVFVVQDGELRTGMVPQEEKTKPVYAKSQLIQWDAAVQPEDRIKASRVVENILGLTGEEKKQIQNLLEGLF